MRTSLHVLLRAEAEQLPQGQTELRRGDAVEHEVQRMIRVGHEQRDRIVEPIAMLLIEILKDLSEHDGSEKDDEDEIQYEQHVGDLLGTARSTARLTFDF